MYLSRQVGASLFSTLLLGLAAQPARADAGYYLLTPYDREGMVTLEARYWTVKAHRRPEATWPELAAGYGVNSRWTTTLLASWEGRTGQATKLSTLNWQNTVLLTQGEGAWDAALHLQWIKSRQGEPDATEFGLLLQTELGPVFANANAIVERPAASSGEPAALKLQWQLAVRVAPGLRAGLLGFDELGPWDRWSPHAQQSHRAGPALEWTQAGPGRGGVKLQAAWLEGRTYGRSGHMASLRAATSF